MLSKEQEDERSAATADASPRDAVHSNAVGLIIKKPEQSSGILAIIKK
ncbi:MAG: hypothetical protein WDN26_10910 [Chitinophagaceae bacterium]